MANLSLQDADLRASDLKLLETGILADTEIICRGRTFKVHKLLLTSRSVWFQKALTGGFKEASTRQINIEEEEPEAIEVILKYIYGGGRYIDDDRVPHTALTACQAAGVDIFKETRGKPIFKTCVDIFRAARYLLLYSLLPVVQHRLKSHCDFRLKQLCTRHTGAGNADAKIWAIDLGSAIHIAYKYDLAIIKMILWEFVWAGRWQLLGGGACDISCLVNYSPEFIKDVLHNCATKQWLNDPIWAPRPGKLRYRWNPYCARCNRTLASTDTNEAEGQVFDPFTMGEGNKVRREWCRTCSDLDMIPWRDPSY